ncbi:hypothetical protein [Dactylosporangium matsuzakiense]|uniref:YD repeat-containing protein n=1 Tax=Dactylosporangium matsuzakiense TaxID=53360 RepID=A0A9W6NR15_9ACTN|nr:hypothetical protein [Dactylosporangium matsuzakiense]GLL05923.1 hypothetical protein GCM10017581_076710 [Dactylosporangium matsuzakiense]
MIVTNAKAYAVTTIADGARGNPIQIIDANNKVTTAQYDPLGRLSKVFKPHSPAISTPDLAYTYTILGNTAPNNVSTKALAGDGTQNESFQIYDGRLQLRQTQTPSQGPSGGRVITDVAYDNRGLTTQTSTLWNSGAPIGLLAGFSNAAVDR